MGISSVALEGAMLGTENVKDIEFMVTSCWLGFDTSFGFRYERQRVKETMRMSKKKRESIYLCVCICVSVYMCVCFHV